MLHNLAGATIQVVNLINYNCHPQKYGENTSEYQDLQQPQTTDQSKTHEEET